jgi:RNA polymerase sigma-70 factor (ECF subfamily)
MPGCFQVLSVLFPCAAQNAPAPPWIQRGQGGNSITTDPQQSPVEVMEADFFNQVRRCYDENRQGLFTYALSLTRDRAVAEDAVHGVICRLLDRGKMPGEVRPYLFRAVRNAVVDNWRRGASREEPLFDLQRPEDGGGEPDLVLQLQQCLFRLEQDQREVVVLKIYQGLTFREIGEVRGQSANTAASHYRRGLKRMKAMLEEDA